MNMEMKNDVATIRNFNRNYTNLLGLLDQHILESELSLAEARVLHEIDKAEHCTSKELAETLFMDTGYLSRILKKFEKLGFIVKSQSSVDGRAYNIEMTQAGKIRIYKLNDGASAQIADLIAPLSELDRSLLVQSMTRIGIMLQKEKVGLHDIQIRTNLKSGDAGYITYMHGCIYQEEYGYSPVFEAYVAESFYDYIKNFDPDRDCLWCAEHHGQIVGCIAIVGHADRAQLRWFLTDPHYRGIGLGKYLLHEAVKYAKEKQYKCIYLDTTSDLTKAISMYEAMGFQQVSSKPNDEWRKGTLELELEMEI